MFALSIPNVPGDGNSVGIRPNNVDGEIRQSVEFSENGTTR